MTHEDTEGAPIEEPLAALERRLISEYLQQAGYSIEELHARDSPANLCRVHARLELSRGSGAHLQGGFPVRSARVRVCPTRS